MASSGQVASAHGGASLSAVGGWSGSSGRPPALPAAFALSSLPHPKERRSLRLPRRHEIVCRPARLILIRIELICSIASPRHLRQRNNQRTCVSCESCPHCIKAFNPALTDLFIRAVTSCAGFATLWRPIVAPIISPGGRKRVTFGISYHRRTCFRCLARQNVNGSNTPGRGFYPPEGIAGFSPAGSDRAARRRPKLRRGSSLAGHSGLR